jgi:hypothetical protein
MILVVKLVAQSGEQRINFLGRHGDAEKSSILGWIISLELLDDGAALGAGQGLARSALAG